MGNIFPPNKDLHEIYDLKGSTFGRVVDTKEIIRSKVPFTLKDLNWVKERRSLTLGPEKATMLINQLKTDCQFLSKLQIMDYSLLVGIHFISRGNTEGIRDRSLMVLEPSESGSTAFKQTAFTSTQKDQIPREYIFGAIW